MEIDGQRDMKVERERVLSMEVDVARLI